MGAWVTTGVILGVSMEQLQHVTDLWCGEAACSAKDETFLLLACTQEYATNVDNYI